MNNISATGKYTLRFLSTKPNRPAYSLCLQRHADPWLLIMDTYARGQICSWKEEHVSSTE